jgi:hypothetical protein
MNLSIEVVHLLIQFIILMSVLGMSVLFAYVLWEHNQPTSQKIQDKIFSAKPHLEVVLDESIKKIENTFDELTNRFVKS